MQCRIHACLRQLRSFLARRDPRFQVPGPATPRHSMPYAAMDVMQPQVMEGQVAIHVKVGILLVTESVSVRCYLRGLYLRLRTAVHPGTAPVPCLSSVCAGCEFHTLDNSRQPSQGARNAEIREDALGSLFGKIVSGRVTSGRPRNRQSGDVMSQGHKVQSQPYRSR